MTAEQVRARFVGKCVEVARERMGRIVAAMADANQAKLVQFELHSLAGEAAVVGLKELAGLARDAEQDARSWNESGDTTAQVACARKIRAVRRAIDEAEKEAAASKPAPASTPTERAVLIVDDSAIVGTKLAGSFVASGVSAAHVASHEEALASIGRQQFAAVVVDINIPGSASVTDFVDQVRSASRGCAPAMVVMSGMSVEEIERAVAGLDVRVVSKVDGVERIVDIVGSAMKDAT